VQGGTRAFNSAPRQHCGKTGFMFVGFHVLMV
jgi:hypothetical protein